VFDKVRENAPKTSVAGKMTYTQMMNLSLNQVFPRSFNATMSAIIPVASLLVIGSYIYGAVTLQEFALALFVGLLVGAYSSLYVASPVVAWIKEREPRNRQTRERLAARDEALGGSAPGPIDEPIAATVAAPAASPATREPASSGTAAGTGRPANWSGNHPPRPRKKRKK
jgi:preprotein translocase subunit SecF